MIPPHPHQKSMQKIFLLSAFCFLLKKPAGFFNKINIKVHNNSEVSLINDVRDLIVEAYVGEYASGKSEVAINRALALRRQGREVTIVDLDLVEPFYTLRPLKKKLEQEGLKVIAWETKETMGLGEAGYTLKPETRWALKSDSNLIIDGGYGVEGAKVLNLLEGIEENPHLKIFIVINLSRPITGNLEAVVDYVRTLGKVDGLINNTHLGDETAIDIIQNGAQEVSEAAAILGVKMIATVAREDLAARLGSADCRGNPIWPIKRYMTEAFW